MRAARAMWRFLNHPVLSAAGSLSLLFAIVPLAAAVIVAGVGRVIDQPTLFVVAVGLALAGFAAVAYLAVRQWRSQPSKKPNGYGPAERRETLDNLFYPPADPKRELAERCSSFATKLTVFNEEMEARKEHAVARYAQEIREGDPGADPFQARKDAESHFERQVEASYNLEMREEALRLFDESREQGAIAAKVRRVADRPLAVELVDIPNLFLAIARRLGEKPFEYRWPPSTPLPTALPAQIDNLMREGIDLVSALSVPIEPQRTEGGWKVEGGDAPDEWWEEADSLQRRIRDLLVQSHPALLTDFRDGFNAHLKKEREAKKPDPPKDTRSTAAKMLALANFERSGPRRVVEACLEGLSAVRHRLGFGGQQAA